MTKNFVTRWHIIEYFVVVICIRALKTTKHNVRIKKELEIITSFMLGKGKSRNLIIDINETFIGK